MPGMSGRDLAAAVAIKYPDLKVLYMSGYTDETLLNHGVLDDNITLIGKLFSSSQLTRAIRKLLNKQQDGPA